MADPKPPVSGPDNSSERRRTHRLQITMPVIVRGGTGTHAFEEETRTVSVNANGCMVYLAAQLTRSQQVSIVNPKTAEELPCRVTFIGQRDSNKLEVGLEFSEASPLFWRIAFPPEDWDPSERKRASGPHSSTKR
ncbi:MAG TPA: PilZ domain-containing protein [Candidatus Acidoferrales bacterium]|nr:PilZ domain-containing protein [Candidatus Acidoferrales bacterium]